MKIGLLAYSTDTGLGYQTQSFFNHIQPTKVLIADLNAHNGVETHHERFPGARIDNCSSIDYLSRESCEWLVDEMDLIFVCETPLNHYLFEYAKRKNVKTILQYNYEFLGYFRRPDLPKPDVLASPTFWGIHNVSFKNWGQVVYWPVPIDIEKFKFRTIEKAQTFVHIIGRPAIHDRNGTVAFLEAAKQLSEYKYHIFLQRPKEWRTLKHFQEVEHELRRAKRILQDRLIITEDVEDNLLLYSDTAGEILVLPRRYGGLCLPMWEALASGMPTIMTDVSPNNTILPAEWLVNASHSGNFQAHATIDLYSANVDSLVKTMKHVAKNIKSCTKQSREMAEKMSWDNQKPHYFKRFKEICG